MVALLSGVAFICSIIVIVNLHQHKRLNNPKIAAAGMLALAGMIVLVGVLGFAAISTSETSSNSDASQLTGFALFLASIVLGILGIALVLSHRFRVFIQQQIISSDGKERRYHPDSPVHTTAILLMFLASINTIGNFIAAGGIEGLANQLTEISAVDLVTSFIMYVALALTGVGLFVRRDISRTMRRLGVELPEQGKLMDWLKRTTYHLAIGIIVGFGVFWVQVALSLVWQLSVSPETLTEQSAAAQAIFNAIGGSLWLGFLVAVTAGIGEELLFRGALQPIFGNIITSIFFVLLHSQYILTPAALIIFVVSVIFGLLRTRYSTTSAMMAHFVYNFTPFVLVHILTSSGVMIGTLG